MELNTPIPGFLAKHGIKSVSDNVPDGGSVQPPAGIFFMLFEDDLMNSDLVQRRDVSAGAPGADPKR